MSDKDDKTISEINLSLRKLAHNMGIMAKEVDNIYTSIDELNGHVQELFKLGDKIYTFYQKIDEQEKAFFRQGRSQKS